MDPVAEGINLKEIAYSISDLLIRIDPTGPRPGTEKTPERVARMYAQELCAGYNVDIESLFTTFPNEEKYEGMVLIKDIPVISLCEHHLVPIVGHAHVGYVPTDTVIGLSKIPRLVDAYARRLQLQERLTQQITNSLQEHLNPLGVMVLIEAEHYCLIMRGVEKPGTKTISSAVTGVFLDNKKGTKDEFLSLIGRS